MSLLTDIEDILYISSWT